MTRSTSVAAARRRRLRWLRETRDVGIPLEAAIAAASLLALEAEPNPCPCACHLVTTPPADHECKPRCGAVSR
jgi:hypothetical protein